LTRNHLPSQCPLCGGTKKPGTTTFTAELEFGIVMVRSVPALRVGRDFPVTKSMTSAQGRKYIVDGALQTPVGQTVMVRTRWIVDEGETRPRLVTAYPKEVES
jgi:hypothetical protein